MLASRRRHWKWLVSGVLALLVGTLVGARTEASGWDLTRYPSNGFRSIAEGNAATFYIVTGNFTSGDQATIGQAHGAWNNTRAKNLALNYMVQSGTQSNWQQNHVYRSSTLTPEYGALQDRGTATSCLGSPPPGQFCRTHTLVRSNVAPVNVGGLIHELGHNLFGLADHGSDPMCTTIMGPCWGTLTAPTTSDAHSGRRFYSIPDDLSVFPNYGGGTVDYVCWTDNSISENIYRLSVWKWHGSGWVWQHTHNVARSGSETTSEGWTCFGEDVAGELGAGFYLYGVEGHNQFSDGLNAWQHGGFTDWFSQ